ncbi:MAG TPA: hypothetical protein PK263_00315 [bacterium]|nr:hypothetical protein [bacterium]
MNNQKDDQVKQALELLTLHERVIGNLYEVYAHSHNFDFWQELAREEAAHAHWITSLERGIAFGKIQISDSTKFDLKGLKASIDQINKMLDDAKNHSEKQALETAYALEKSILEDKFLSIVSSTDPEVCRVLRELERETKVHREALEDELRTIKA